MTGPPVVRSIGPRYCSYTASRYWQNSSQTKPWSFSDTKDFIPSADCIEIREPFFSSNHASDSCLRATISSGMVASKSRQALPCVPSKAVTHQNWGRFSSGQRLGALMAHVAVSWTAAKVFPDCRPATMTR